MATASIVITSSQTPLSDSTITAGVEVILSATIAGSIANKTLQLVLRDPLGKLVTTCSTSNGAISSAEGDSTQSIVSISIPAIATASIKKNTKISFYFQAVSTTNTINTLSAGEFLIVVGSGTPDPTPTPNPAQGQSYQWATIAGSSAMTAGNGYICTGLSLQTLTLPSVASIGDRIAVWGTNSALFRVAQNAGQQIRMGSRATTIGIAGRIDSLEQGDLLELVYLKDGTWVAVPSQGQFDVG